MALIATYSASGQAARVQRPYSVPLAKQYFLVILLIPTIVTILTSIIMQMYVIAKEPVEGSRSKVGDSGIRLGIQRSLVSGVLG